MLAADIMTTGSPEEIRVDLGRRAYPVVVGPGTLNEVGPRLAAGGLQGRVAVVTSARVGRLWRAPLVRSLAGAGLVPFDVTVPDGEEHKTLATVSGIWDALLDAGVDRRTAVIALGGGVVGDMAGFAAATLLRGLPVVQVPTTLLAQVDAAIGGKTGIDHPAGKNLIGAFHQPRLVVCDTDTLGTLPRRELVAGLAEVIKYGVIGDAGLLARIEHRLDGLLTLDPEVVRPVVASCVRQKAAVVAADEREESGARAVLNFGHTVGHAVEAATGYGRLLHGEAVAIGMVAAARISLGLGLCAPDVVARLTTLLERAGLPTGLPDDMSPEALARHLARDKKVAGARVRFVAVEAIGRTRFVELTVDDITSRV